MTENQNKIQKIHEAGTEIPASFVSNPVVLRKEPLMNKLGYFFVGIVAGAVALGAAAFLMDGTDDTPVGSNPEEEFGQDENSAAAEPSEPVA